MTLDSAEHRDAATSAAAGAAAAEPASGRVRVSGAAGWHRSKAAAAGRPASESYYYELEPLRVAGLSTVTLSHSHVQAEPSSGGLGAP